MIVCANCGVHLPEGSAFCSKCGTRLVVPPASTRSHTRRGDVSLYDRVARSMWENMEDREIAVDELERLGARNELMRIARNPWISPEFANVLATHCDQRFNARQFFPIDRRIVRAGWLEATSSKKEESA